MKIWTNFDSFHAISKYSDGILRGLLAQILRESWFSGEPKNLGVSRKCLRGPAETVKTPRSHLCNLKNPTASKLIFILGQDLARMGELLVQPANVREKQGRHNLIVVFIVINSHNQRYYRSSFFFINVIHKLRTGLFDQIYTYEQWFWIRIWIRSDPHSFGSVDLDPHSEYRAGSRGIKLKKKQG